MSPRKRNPIPADLKPEDVVAIVDTREQLPLDLRPLQTVLGTLKTADYSIQFLEELVAVERKSLPDFLNWISNERERSDAVTQRMLAYPTRCIVIESTWQHLEEGGWKNKVTPAAAVGTCLSWISRGIPVVLCGDHDRAGRFVSRLLYLSARKYWRTARGLAAGIIGDSEPAEMEGSTA